MIPALGWIPPMVGQAFPVFIAEAPRPIVGTYRDFSALEPVSESAMPRTVLLHGAHVVVTRQGEDAAGERTLRVQMEMHEVFGVALVDRIDTNRYYDADPVQREPRPVSAFAGQPRPVSAWATEGRPASAFAGEGRPGTGWNDG